MSDIRVTSVEDTLDGVSVADVSLSSFDGLPISGGGGGAVDSVNGKTGVVVLAASDVGAQPVDTDLTAIAALSTTTFGRSLLALADAAAARSALGLGTAATSASTAFDASGAAASAQAASQPLDSDLTAIAALTTTTFGRALLTQADAAAARSTLGAGTSSLAIGVTGSTAAAGNDSRLSDARTPTAHASSHASAGSDPVTIAESQVTGLVTDLAGKAASTHTHAESDITNLTSDLAAKAPLASPAFTGTPAAPTATAGTNTTQVATTAFVAAAVVGAGGYVDPLTTKGDIVGRSASATVRKAVGSNGAALFADSAQTDGLNWRAIAESDVTNLTSDLSAKAPLASPTFTGTPAAPTVAGTSDSTTKVATTAFVQAVAALLAPLASPALTGNPTAPTQTAGNNSTRVATTAFVTAAVAAGGGGGGGSTDPHPFIF